MSSKRSVKFAALDNDEGHRNKKRRAEAGAKRGKRKTDDDDDMMDGDRKKKSRPSVDDMDDMDDVNAWGETGEKADAEDEDAIPSEKQLLDAKQKRRQQAEGGTFAASVDGATTQINSTTSLEVEGVQVEPFHMDQEKSDGTGYFDGDTYIFRKESARDVDEEPDAWLENLNVKDQAKTDGSDQAPKKASANSFMISQAKSKAKKHESDRDSLDEMSRRDLYRKIAPLVSDSETVGKAVRRYGNLIKAYQKACKQRKKAASAINDDSSDQTQLQKEAADDAKESLDELTGAANALLFKGDVDVYETTRAQMMKVLSSADANAKASVFAKVPTAKQKKPQEKQPPCKWEYKGNQDNQVHGSYTTAQLIDWTKAGYFIGAQAVQIRSLRKPEKSTKDDLLADLMDDDESDDDDDEDLVKGEWQSSNDVNFEAYLPVS